MVERTKLVAANVRRSLRLLAGGAPPFSAEALSVAQESGFRISSLFSIESLTASPVFYRAGGDLRCAQDNFFGFYILCQAIRACLGAVNFQIAGSSSLNSELYAPASALFYTAAYHALAGFLAINGRALTDSTSFMWLSKDEPPTVIAACLTKRNSWKYEPRSRSHKARWLELNPLFAPKDVEIPRCFRQLFGILFAGRHKKGATLLDIISEPGKHRIQLEDHLQEFLEKIAEVRHIALYRSYGEDPHVVEAMVNGEPVQASKLGRQAGALGLFSQALLGETARFVRGLVDGVRVNKEMKGILYLGTGLMWMDRPRSDLWIPNDIQQDIDFIHGWLKTCDEDPKTRRQRQASNPAAQPDGYAAG